MGLGIGCRFRFGSGYFMFIVCEGFIKRFEAGWGEGGSLLG